MKPLPTDAPRPFGKAGLWALILLAGIVALGAIFYGLWLSSTAGYDKNGEYSVTVPFVAPVDQVPSIEVDASAESSSSQEYDTVVVGTINPPAAAPILTGITTAPPFLIVLTGCIGIIVLAARLLRGKPFSTAGQIVLTVLGAVSAASAILIPWLDARAVELTVVALGMPTDGTMVADADQDPWVAPPGFDLLQDMQWPAFTLGVLLLLVALLWRRATRLQHDTEGLI